MLGVIFSSETEIAAPTKIAPVVVEIEQTQAPVDVQVKQEVVAPAATSTPQESRQTYVNNLASMMASCIVALDAFGKVANEAGSNPRIIQDPDWSLRAAIGIVDLRDCGHALIERRDIPSGFEETDGYLVKAGSELLDMTDDFVYGVDHIDASYLYKAADHMFTSVDYIDKANVAMPRE